MTPTGSNNDCVRKRRWPAYVLSWKVGLPLAALLLAVSGVMGYRESQLYGLPDIGHPFDVEEFYAIDVPLGENAWPDYEAAYALLVSPPLVSPPRRFFDDVNLALEDGWNAATPEVRQWLADNRPALERWRAGTEKPFCLRIRPRDITIDTFTDTAPSAHRYNDLAMLMALRHESAEELRAAWTWHRALFRYSQHRGMYDSLTERLHGYSIHATASHFIVRWSAMPELGPADLSAALADLRNDYPLTAPFSRTLKYDYLISVHMIDGLKMDIRDVIEDLVDITPTPDYAFPGADVLYLYSEPEVTQRLMRQQMANLLPHIDRPQCDRPPLVGEFLFFDAAPAANPQIQPAASFSARVQVSPVANVFLVRRVFADIHVREQAFQAVLEVTLAAEWYRRVHGELPEDLSQLVTAGILPEVPDDPWSPVPAPLRYEREPGDSGRAKVWSVGQNGVDDGGEIAPADYSVGDVGLWIGGEPDSE